MSTQPPWIRLVGYQDTKKALSVLAPDLRRGMDKEIRSIIAPLAAAARAKVPDSPLSGWATGSGARSGAWSSGGRLGWDPSAVRSGIGVSQGSARQKGSTFSAAWTLRNKTPAGAVFEVAGRTTGGTTPQNRAFRRGLDRAGAASRGIWAAFDEAGGTAPISARIQAAVDKAETELQARLDAAAD